LAPIEEEKVLNEEEEFVSEEEKVLNEEENILSENEKVLIHHGTKGF
jgi:hypothetical protein